MDKSSTKNFLERESAWLKLDNDKIFDFCEDYKTFISENKIEREVADYIVSILKKKGFNDIAHFSSLKSGDKVYKTLRGKGVIAATIGKDNSKSHILGSHIDSPRLDLKPYPLIEDSEIAFMKTHYYGGIKKYQWVNVPLALHGVVLTKSGKKITLKIGENDKDPIFIIPDLLPHLAKKQLEKIGSELIEGEQLNLLVGSIPVKDKKIKERIKSEVLNKLNKEYGITEEDFLVAEIEVVPSAKARDVGFDKSLIAAYGQDDKVCVFTTLMAFIEAAKPKQTTITMFFDKEEIGSVGNTGAHSFALLNFAKEILELSNSKISAEKFLENSNSISADVTAAMDPNFKEVFDPNNSSFIGKGIVIEKYGGSFGKYSSNDASAEYMHFLRDILNNKKIPWQSGEAGKIDVGGGGTIALFMSRHGMNCVDAGPGLLAMHAPMEISSKVDVYSSYLFYKAFLDS